MSACTELSYNAFGERLNRAGARDRIPLAGSIEVTFKCNLRCVHCYIPDYSGRNEMSTAEISRILSEIADAGCLYLLLTGGEVLSRADFPEIYLRAKRLGLLLTVFTNGTLLDERTADLLAEYPPHGLEITLYGLSDEMYLRTTGFPGRFTAVRRAIDLILARGLPLTLKAVAMEPLADEIAKMQAFAESIGAHFRSDPIIHARLDGSLGPTTVRPSPERAVRHDTEDPRRLADYLRYYREYVLTTQPTHLLMSCGAGLSSFHIDPHGTLLSCEALPLNGYDLRRGTFRDGWYGIVGAIRGREAAATNVCASCELRALCDRCPATAMLETGSPDGWVPYFCEVTHRRAAVLEEKMGNAEKAARFRAHAEKVASGWTPPGAVLPRATPFLAAGAGCAGGACATGCGKSATKTHATQLLKIDRPRTDPASQKEAVP
ncbi:MAG: radical SAM protein [Acidobacteria bacterium]|nr:radical SAM protein [Acidobacteriota bacterium]